jgi:hypothetical protein
VKHDDVTHAQPSLEPDPSWLERALVDTLLEAAELPVVAGISVQQVVDALGDPKERRAAADHRPVGVDSSVEPVGRDRAQQLGDPASHRRGVEHPHRAPAQCLAAVGERESQRAPAVLGDHPAKDARGGRARAGSPVDRGLARSSHAGDQQPPPSACPLLDSGGDPR